MVIPEKFNSNVVKRITPGLVQACADESFPGLTTRKHLKYCLKYV